MTTKELPKPQYKPGEIIDGRIKVMRNGSGYDLEAKRISHAPNTFPTGYDTSITHASAPELAKRKHELAKEKTRKQTVELFKDTGEIPDTGNFDDVVAILGSEAIASGKANMMDKPREAVHAGTFGLRLAGYESLVMKERRVDGVQIAVQVNVVNDPGELDEDW